jgi:hypothetical protein
MKSKAGLPVTPPKSAVQVDPTRMITLHGDILERDGKLDPASPLGEFYFLHAAFDFTGRRMLWAGGPTWGPEDFPGSGLGKLRAGTTLFFGEPNQAVTKIDVGQGQAMDAFPFADPQAKWIYFSRFFYGTGEVDVPGWYLMKIAREKLEGGGIQTPEFVESTKGKVLGSQPFVDATGSYLLYVKPDPRNVGTDLWVLPLENGPNEEEKLWEAEGEPSKEPPQASADLDKWREYSVLGKARIGHPVLSPDRELVIFACDRGDWLNPGEPTTWDLYGLKVREENGTLKAQENEDHQLEKASEPKVDETWPTISGDGYWIAYSRKARDEDEPEIKILRIRDDNGELETRGELRDHEADGGAMWPQWNQDEDPPHILVKIQVSDGSPPLVVRLLDREPDLSAQTDVMNVGLQFHNYNPRIPDPSATPEELAKVHLPPLDFILPPGSAATSPPPATAPKDTSLDIEYPTQGPTGNSFYLLLAGDRSIGRWKGFKDQQEISPSPSGKADQAMIDHLKSDKVQGLFFSENVRVSVQVLARDNQWRRVPPDSKALSLKLYSNNPQIEVHQIFEKDPRSVKEKGGEIHPPYLQPRDRDKVLPPGDPARGLPGISWWVEEGPEGVEVDQEDQIKNASQDFNNAPFLLFRSGNYSGKPNAPKDFNRFLRIVVRDLLANVTDIRIPLYVKNRDFSVSSLRSGSKRFEKGP